MQSDTTPGLTQGVPGAPDDGHETAFLNVEKHRSSLGERVLDTLKQKPIGPHDGREPSGDNHGPAPDA